jgi:hypothetical protein
MFLDEVMESTKPSCFMGVTDLPSVWYLVHDVTRMVERMAFWRTWIEQSSLSILRAKSFYHLSSFQKNSSSESSLEVLQGSLMVFVTCVRVVEIKEGRKAETISSEHGL